MPFLRARNVDPFFAFLATNFALRLIVINRVDTFAKRTLETHRHSGRKTLSGPQRLRTQVRLIAEGDFLPDHQARMRPTLCEIIAVGVFGKGYPPT
jgi:hypothetical protein